MTELHWIRKWMPVRIQFTLHGVLIAECIVQGTNEAERVRNKYMNKHDHINAHEMRDSVRFINANVGERIK